MTLAMLFNLPIGVVTHTTSLADHKVSLSEVLVKSSQFMFESTIVVNKYCAMRFDYLAIGWHL